MIGTSSSAKDGALGSKAARACDGCLRRRARWYCAADDAFLCQGCDTSVHSANPLARRHERLRLHPSSSPLQPPPAAAASAGGGEGSNNNSSSKREVVPAWFRRKARTPRGGGHAGTGSNNSNSKSGAVVGRELSRRLVVVPEASASEKSLPDEGRMSCVEEEEEEHLLYRVPVFDPTLAEFCSPPPPPLEESSCGNDEAAVTNPTKTDAAPPPPTSTTQFFPDGGHAAGFEPTDAELREFAADMEALLGRGLDDGTDEDSSFYMETLGLLDPVLAMDGEDSDAARVKVEAENNCFGFDAAAACRFEADPEEASDEMLDIDFDYGSPTQEEEEEKAASSGGTGPDGKLLQRSLSLTLNYEAIIQSWGTSPWTGGGDRPPHVKIDDCWPHDYTGMWMVGGVVGHGGVGGEELSLPRLGMDGGREARVSRYREKRRTRLFSKKIRYEVRKLNAEKRPRMKGRFVKRATAGGGASVAIAGLA